MGKINLELNLVAARLVMKALNNASCTEPLIATIYQDLSDQIEEAETSRGVWRKVIDRSHSSISRARNGNSTYRLKLECGHTIRSTEQGAAYVKRKRCKECRETGLQPPA